VILSVEKAKSFVAVVGSVLLLAGLLAAPAWAQTDQYDDERAICQAVISIIINNDLDSDQYSSDDGVNDIAQRLDVSSSIVQSCIEGQFGDFEAEATNIINIPDKPLPQTGGPSLPLLALFTLVGAGLSVAILRRRS
jgi:hypothetical protein